MISKKASKIEPRDRAARARGVTASRAPRARSHALAPAHLGEAASAAVLAVAVLGLAVFIAGVAMSVSGMTVAERFGSNPPPNVDELGTGQLFGGIGLAALGLVLSGSSLAVLADVARSRAVAAAASTVAAALAVVGVVLVQAQPGGDVVLAGALAAAAIVFAVAAFILVRPRR